MSKNELEKFSVGQQVQLTDGVLHQQYAWQYGTVEKVIKSRNMISVRLESGDRYDAYPQNVIAKEPEMQNDLEECQTMMM